MSSQPSSIRQHVFIPGLAWQPFLTAAQLEAKRRRRFKKTQLKVAFFTDEQPSTNDDRRHLRGEKIKQTKKKGRATRWPTGRLRGAKTKLPVCSHLNATFSCDLCERQRKHYEKTFSKHNSLQQFTLYGGKTAETNIWAASIMKWIYLYRTNWVKGSVTNARPHQRTSLCSRSKHFTDATGASNESY